MGAKRFPDYGDELDEEFLWYGYDGQKDFFDEQAYAEQEDYRYDEGFNSDGYEWEG